MMSIDLYSKEAPPLATAVLDGYGILIAEVESNTLINRLGIEPVEGGGRRFFLESLPRGRRYQVLQLPAGRYRWERLEVLQRPNDRRTRSIRWDLSDDREDLEFDVYAGKVNYPGILVLTRKHVWMTSFTINRSGELARQLLSGPKWLLTDYPVVYSGRRRDDFLEYYSRRVAEQAPERSENAGSDGSDENDNAL
jgi:hypothetical protein